MNLGLAIQYSLDNGNHIEQARLNYLLHGQSPSPAIVAEFSSTQNQDGSWSPFWATGYSSLDATCFHLAQAHQLGISMNEPVLSRALTFLTSNQDPDGSWEEDQSVVDIVPPWAKPGDLSAKLYITANCGYWLVVSQTHLETACKTGFYLKEHLEENGQLPSFAQTHWLSAGIWHALGMAGQIEKVMRYLMNRLDDFSANNLTWMITALRVVKIPADQPLILEALSRLESLQQVDGYWQSDDGPEYDVHTTLEALFALKLCERI